MEDLDGNVLRIGADAKKGELFGEWRDMRGQIWVGSRESGWTRKKGMPEHLIRRAGKSVQ